MADDFDLLIQIAELKGQVAALTAERDALRAERDHLLHRLHLPRAPRLDVTP